MSHIGKGTEDFLVTENEQNKTSNFKSFELSSVQDFDYISGYYYTLNIFSSESSSAITLNSNTIYCVPCIIRKDITIDQLVMPLRTTTHPSNNGRVALYNQLNGKPSTVYKDFGTFALNPISKILSVSESITKGMYFFAIMTDINQSWTTGPNPMPYIFPLLPSDPTTFSDQIINCLSYSQTFSSGFPDLTSSTPTLQNSYPTLAMRVA